MTRRRTRGVARILIGSWAVAGVLALAPAEASGHEEARAAAPGATAPVEAVAVSVAGSESCVSQLSCGFDCVAKLMVGYCADIIEWEGQFGIGPVTLLPSFRIVCEVCECWYVMPGPNGSVFKRTTKVGCEGAFDGLTVH